MLINDSFQRLGQILLSAASKDTDICRITVTKDLKNWCFLVSICQRTSVLTKKMSSLIG